MKRKLTLQILRALGVGKSTFSTGIEEEVETLLQYMERYLEQNFYVQVRHRTFVRVIISIDIAISFMMLLVYRTSKLLLSIVPIKERVHIFQFIIFLKEEFFLI